MRFKLVEEIIEEVLKSGPLMIRRDGKVFNDLPNNMHPYGTDGPDYALDYCDWLYHSTAREQTKKLIIKFLSEYCYAEKCSIYELFGEYASDLNERFAKEIEPLLDKETRFSTNAYMDTWAVLDNALNQEFLRARYGGAYNTGDIAKFNEMVFRVSSEGFNWFDIIYMFVSDNKKDIGYVTIVHDRDSTDDDSPYVHKGVKFNQMPIDEFLTISGNPDIS